MWKFIDLWPTDFFGSHGDPMQPLCDRYLSICAYVCMYVRACVRAYVRTYVCMYVCRSLYSKNQWVLRVHIWYMNAPMDFTYAHRIFSKWLLFWKNMAIFQILPILTDRIWSSNSRCFISHTYMHLWTLNLCMSNIFSSADDNDYDDDE